MKRSIVGLAMLAFATIANAQDVSGNGFLFGAPTGTITLRTGYSLANAGSDVFSFVTNELTINRRDFSSFSWGGDVAFRLNDRLDAVVSGDFSGMNHRSEFRDWLDNNNKPIEQNTQFQRQSYTVGLKYYFLPSGRNLGRLAWIPAKYAPYVGIGAGRMWYQFKQDGDFIDFKDNNRVYHDLYDSSDWTGTAHLLGGVDWSLNERWGVTTQAKYEMASAELSRDFSGFQRIDLSGLNATVGLTVRF